MNGIVIIAVISALAIVAMAGEGGTSKHKVVFEFVSEGEGQMESVLNNVENLKKALGPETQVILIAHGPGLGLLMKTNTTSAKRIEALWKQEVVFAACENTLKRKKLSRADLLPGITTVDSGVAEVVRRQEAGWSYVKSGH